MLFNNYVVHFCSISSPFLCLLLLPIIVIVYYFRICAEVDSTIGYVSVFVRQRLLALLQITYVKVLCAEINKTKKSSLLSMLIKFTANLLVIDVLTMITITTNSL